MWEWLDGNSGKASDVVRSDAVRTDGTSIIELRMRK